MVVDVTNCMGHGMARQATVLPQRVNKENSEMVRDAVVYGREATKFQRTLLPLSSNTCVFLHAEDKEGRFSEILVHIYTKPHSITSKEDTIFIRTDLNFNSTSPHGHMSMR